jgi:putative ABC transport system permease protein
MSWWRRERRESDLARELRGHLALEAEEQRRAGLAPEDARFAALRAFGNRTTIEEDTRMTWPWISVEKLGQDLRYAGRMAHKNPLFTTLAILTLALGIGANTAIFSVVDTVLLRPLPYRDAARLVRIETRNEPLYVHNGPASYPDFLDWQASRAFEDVGIYSIGNSLVRIGDTSERLLSGAATASLFSTLGVRPLLGRLPLPEEDKSGASPVTLLTESLWRERFGRDPSIVGRSIDVDGKPSVVVGVLPASFVFERSPELWTTFERNEDLTTRQNRFLSVLARLAPGESIQQADSRLIALCSHLAAQFPNSNKGWSANAYPWQESMAGPVRSELLVLLGAVCLVLFICCGNVAMLLLVRGIGRTREFGLRTALGASRPRIAVQLLTENLLLSLVGGGLGAALATWCVALLVKYGPSDIPRLAEVHMDARVLLFALALTFLTLLLFGLGPALQLSKPDVNTALQEGGKSSTVGRRRALLRTGFLIAEMALSLLLLAGAGLLVKSFLRLASVEPGFRPDHLLTFQLQLPDSKFLKNGQFLESQVARYYKDVIDRLGRLPQVESAAGAMDIPMVGGGYRLWQGFALPGNPSTGFSKTLCAVEVVTKDYFHTMGIPLKNGRGFTERDTKNAPLVAMVNQTFASKYFAGLNPIGQSIQLEGVPVLVQVVGVVGDVKPDGLDSGANPEVYAAYAQVVRPFLLIALRTKTDPAALIADVRSQLKEIDRDVPPYRIRTGEQAVALSLAERRFSMALVALFALLAMLLAAIGLYGVVSYTVTQGTREIGIRLALGATARDVFVVALRQGLVPSLLGLAIGLALSLGLTPLMSGLLYQVRPLDAGVFALVSLVLLAVCGLACTLPARRATRVDPVTALRYE